MENLLAAARRVHDPKHGLASRSSLACYASTVWSMIE